MLNMPPKQGSGVWAVLASYLQAVALACGNDDRFLNANPSSV